MVEANSNMEVDAEPSNSVNADLDFRDSEVENPIVGSYSLMGSRKYKLEKNLGLAHGFSLMVGLIMGSGEDCVWRWMFFKKIVDCIYAFYIVFCNRIKIISLDLSSVKMIILKKKF